jgi:hypothetical protein
LCHARPRMQRQVCVRSGLACAGGKAGAAEAKPKKGSSNGKTPKGSAKAKLPAKKKVSGARIFLIIKTDRPKAKPAAKRPAKKKVSGAWIYMTQGKGLAFLRRVSPEPRS